MHHVGSTQRSWEFPNGHRRLGSHAQASSAGRRPCRLTRLSWLRSRRRRSPLSIQPGSWTCTRLPACDTTPAAPVTAPKTPRDEPSIRLGRAGRAPRRAVQDRQNDRPFATSRSGARRTCAAGRRRRRRVLAPVRPSRRPEQTGAQQGWEGSDFSVARRLKALIPPADSACQRAVNEIPASICFRRLGDAR